MSPSTRQYLVIGAGVIFILFTGSLVHQLGVPKLLPYVSMGKLEPSEPPKPIGMGPYSLMDHPPLKGTYTSPSLKRIAVVMSVHSNDPLFRASFEGHRRYCQLHGYRFMTQSKEMLPEEPFPHPRGHEYQKMAVLMQALLIGLDTKEYDWILWTDLDTYITDPSIPLESFLPPPTASPNDTQPYFIGNRDFNGFNAGVLFIKVIPWSVQLIAMVIADPYFLYNSGALDDSHEHKPATNDQASLGRIFQATPLFGQHFQEIPASWMNTYAPFELDGTLNTTIPHLLPPKVEEWIQEMDECVSAREEALRERRRWPRRPTFKLPNPPPRLDDDTLEQLRGLRDLPSTFIPNEFKDTLQVHLVDKRKLQFDYLALVSINAQMMQIAMGALVTHFHERLLTSDSVSVWEQEKRDSIAGLRYIQNPGLLERRDKWYREKKIGIEGMSWLDVR
ncbi:hypothetical protein CPB83DRAFT_856424 [Crepidotus variabilis]|uniref:Uncharacterized protein n=1 Tax=Crepidotus variabilis TaxID=179855 RepID=A0A9P6EE01_9AGAR|nr:hypothetical protein CPB83DRAFT_856424 [Crepidotus variabilis]